MADNYDAAQPDLQDTLTHQLNENFMPGKSSPDKSSIDRRDFLAKTATVTTAVVAASSIHLLGRATTATPANAPREYTFASTDSLVHGDDWQTLNPGYWKIENGALRRRLSNYGDRARETGFPYHAQSHGFEFQTQYDPSLPTGIIYSPHWQLSEAFQLELNFTFRKSRPEPENDDDPKWKMYQSGYGVMGVALGAKSIYESYGKIRNSIQIGWTDDNQLKIFKSRRHKGRQSGNQIRDDEVLKSIDAFELREGQTYRLTVTVKPQDQKNSILEATFTDGENSVSLTHRLPSDTVSGYTGFAARGLIDFEVNSFKVDPGNNQMRKVGVADCLSCYALGDALKQVDSKWMVRFVGIFASDGETVEIRVSDSQSPDQGWGAVPVCGTAKIVNNRWRRNTAIIDVTLPFNPADKTQYFTVWKDGKNVTADQRVGTDACGPGTGLVGDVPVSGDYVGRLPRLAAPYRLCGLSCHAITEGLQQRDGNRWNMAGQKRQWQLRDQPTAESYKHLDDYDFQIMVWEDDVWYMELVMYPPSTDDAYKIVTLSICGPTSRWQMMRHWNVLNPGDHEYGMDDVKGPEQLIVRKTKGLGQDPDYLRRNFQIVHHLTTGAEEVDPLENPKKWRAWKMPNRDFAFLVLDSRLWRSSQDVDVWDDQGWNEFKSLYDRTDPTRSLLGEEQFSWLEQFLATDSSPLICLTGINGLHTIWTGNLSDENASKNHPKGFSQRDRVTADYAGWVKAGSDRVIELLGSRSGVVTVYGDVHNGCIMKNVDHRVIECSFGPIGRSGGRRLIPGFGPNMKDVDDRELEIHALYHAKFVDANQNPHSHGDPYYWNFLEMEFDPQADDPKIGLSIRNLVDPPTEKPRGGNALTTVASQTGRKPSCKLPPIKTLPNADVHLTDTNGNPIQGSRSDQTGNVLLRRLVDVEPGTTIVVNAFDGTKSNSQVIKTL